MAVPSLGGHHSNDLPTIFEICTPRKDIRDGLVESELAADLARVAEGEASQEYANPAKFFAGTYPTKGIKELLRQVLTRLGGGSSSAIFWLNTSFGGGKTHALIALLHAAQSPAPSVLSEFTDPALLPRELVRVAVFDGQNADISSGHSIGEGITARTPWGEIAYRLAGKNGYRRVDDGISSSPPGSDTMRELLGDGPALILLDELAVYLRKARMHEGAEGQFAAFLTALIKAVESSPNAALVYTLAASSEADAYSNENRKLLDELKSISARKGTLLNPTEEGETVQILWRRLFERRDESKARMVVDAYRDVWKSNHDRLPDVVDNVKTAEEFRAGYPLHPDILGTLISKTSTLDDFQRVRGMLRLLGHVVHDLWKHRNELKPTAIHLHHFDIGNENIYQEITSKLKQDAFVPAIDTDIACDDISKTSLAQRLDIKHYPNLPPFTTHVARTIFLHTLAFNPQLKGIDDRHLRYSILSPDTDLGYVDEALGRFKRESLYLDDNPDKPTQFQAVPNLNQAIQREEQSLDVSDLENEIDGRIRKKFEQGEFDLHVFPGGHEDIPDDTGKPKLIILRYTDIHTSNPESTPEMVQDIFEHKGIGGGIRLHRNNLVFLVAFGGGLDTVHTAARRHLAMGKLAAADRISDFAEYQQKDIKGKNTTSNMDLDAAILGCYKYVFYPVKGERLTYGILDWKSSGQRNIIDELRDKGKIRIDKDRPDNPDSLLERVAGLSKGEITTEDFRKEFYRNTALPILIGNHVFSAGILEGIRRGIFVYKSGKILCGKGEPDCAISIDASSVVYTMEMARKLGIWPRMLKKSGSGKGVGGYHPSPPSPPPPVPPIRVAGKPNKAVRDVLDELRRRGTDKISGMRINSRDDVFPLLSVLGRIKEVQTRLKMTGDYQTNEGGSFNFEFDGTLEDSWSVQEFLKPQMKNTSVGNIKVDLYISLQGTKIDWLEDLADRLRLVETMIMIFDIRIPE